MIDAFVSCGRVRWRFTRGGEGPLALLVHGTGASSHSFHALSALLSSRFDVVAPDLPGHAASRPARPFHPSLPNMAAELAAFTARVGSPALAVGHSAGAAVLARMTLDGSIAPARLALIAPALAPLEGVKGSVFGAAAKLLTSSRFAPHLLALRAGTSGAVRRALEKTGSRLDRDGVEAYVALAESSSHVRGVLAMLAAWDTRALWSELSRLKDKTELVIISGARDLAIPLAEQRRAAARAGCELFVVADAGHLVHEERPDEVARLVTSGFLARR